jgi:hypothetical protein
MKATERHLYTWGGDRLCIAGADSQTRITCVIYVILGDVLTNVLTFPLPFIFRCRFYL